MIKKFKRILHRLKHVLFDYEQLALCTENEDWQGIAKRLEENIVEVVDVLNMAIIASQKMDQVIKKKGFYGKAPKLYDAPLFVLVDGKLTDEQRARLHNEDFIRLVHGFMGILTEAGEGLEALATHFSTGKEMDLVNIGEENGDVDWYQAIIVSVCNTTFIREQVKNIAKLKARHGAKFSKERVMNRDLERERKILERK